jgi:hypothetical protein
MGEADTITVSPGVDRHLSVVAVGDPAEGRHRLALAAGHDVDDPVVRQHLGIGRLDQDALGSCR